MIIIIVIYYLLENIFDVLHKKYIKGFVTFTDLNKQTVCRVLSLILSH